MWAGFGLLALSWYTKEKAAGSLIFSPGNVTDAYFEGSTPVLEVSILVQNTSSNGLTLQSFAANVMAKQIDSMVVVGNLSGFIPTTIPGNSEGSIIVKLRLFPLGLVTDIIRAWTNKNYKQDLLVSGGVNVAGIPSVRVPISLIFSVGAP